MKYQGNLVINYKQVKLFSLIWYNLEYHFSNKNNSRNFDFSVAQIINEKENKKMHSKSSLDEKLSDLVGTANVKLSKNTNLNYKFKINMTLKKM